MKAFHVWVHRAGNDCRVRVDGMKNTEWLLNRLGQSFVFKTSEPVDEERNSSFCTFRVAYSSQMSRP